jgi:hypothetical protein
MSHTLFAHHGRFATAALLGSVCYALAVYNSESPLAEREHAIPGALAATVRLSDESAYRIHRAATNNRTAALDRAIIRGSGMRAEPWSREPFAAASNAAYVAAALSFLVKPGLPAPAMWFVVASALMGGGSLVFHANGSLTATWQHDADRLGMLLLLTATAVLAAHGAWHATARTVWDGSRRADVAFACAQVVCAACAFPMNWALHPELHGGSAAPFFCAVGALGVAILLPSLLSAAVLLRDACHVTASAAAVVTLFAAGFALNLAVGAAAKRAALFGAALSIA